MQTNREEFERLVLEQLDFLYRVALRLARDSHQAEDLVQEACFRAIRSRESFQMSPGGIRPWLVQILRNAFLTRAGRESRQPRLAEDEALEAAAGPANDTAQSDFRLPVSEYMDQELARAVQTLPEEYRTVLMLWALEDFSYQEIADALKIPIGTVMSRLHRARAKLTEQLKDFAKREGIRRE
jgi:RNA polymerase sigma-70 factor (ECF subfamily)